ncbi:MAG: hypothetical protein HN576_02760 [Bacteriovoracaceae bacterium]|jgi:hypothetical protein|nr:hypothetical protein [Bacteriovoracaceae bacterium]
MRNLLFKNLIIIFSMILLNNVFAKSFTSQYCQFELPPGWECALEGTEWVCQSSNKDRKKEAIIILAAKIRGSQDSLDQYMAYLKKPKTFILPGGKTQVSEAKYSNRKTINGQNWIDSLHMASEVPGFYTRYLATVKEDLGVAVTFSVAKDHYESYRGVFERVIATLKVFRQKAESNANYNLKNKDENLLGDDGTFIPDGVTSDVGYQKRRKKGSGTSTEDLMIYGVIAAVGIGFALKKLKGGPGKKKKKKKKK